MKPSATVAIVVILVLLAIFYFGPAFRGEIQVSPDFYFGPVRLHWYGVLMAAAILASFTIARRGASAFGLRAETVEAVLPWLVLGGLIGGRLYYVGFYWEYFSTHPGEILAFWRGGLAIYGAMAGGALSLLLFAKKRRLPGFLFFDLAALALPLGQAIGRFGNFFNSEAFGSPTNLPWKMFVSEWARPVQYLTTNFFHPTFLYETMWDFAVFLILLYLSRRTLRAGALIGSFLILYPLGRFFIEGLRVDSFFAGGVRVDQVTSLLFMLAGAFIILRLNHNES